MSAYVAAERLFDLISDSQDVRGHQSSSPEMNRNSRSSSPKVVGETNVLASLIPDSNDKLNQAEGEANQIEGEAEARRLRLRWEKDSGRMKVVNSVALPIVELVKRTTIKLGGWKGPVDFAVVRMDDFDVVLGMEFLFEHQVISMPSAKCIVIIGSFPTVVQADIRQPNGFKMISTMQLDKSLTQEEPPSGTIPRDVGKTRGDSPRRHFVCP
ncbi:hypothetical protein E6C27_scaffold79G00840 [Cucumis melo var. makuwa]|uniref:Asp_protease_2 domain-containing protein n=1 Tax=Cucumis melo var. makuwa TaxID=1194695 RepID=A0A5A7VA91_CUCMM|nr:hypothetical protein E6C27_scaffold79G00840 [Cucumis melo var. makuwa]